MNFINNWRQPVALALGATQLALDLPDGQYRLTLADAADTRWEIVDAEVVGGQATLTRAREGTPEQGWPDGSQIYCALTAGLLTDLFARLAALEGGTAPDGALTDASGNTLTDAAGNTLTIGA